jgi:hypothetical protein
MGARTSSKWCRAEQAARRPEAGSSGLPPDEASPNGLAPFRLDRVAPPRRHTPAAIGTVAKRRAGATRPRRHALRRHPPDHRLAPRPDKEPGRDQRAATSVGLPGKVPAGGHPDRVLVHSHGARLHRHAARPAARLREVSRAVEQTACKVFRTEFYPTYDARAVADTLREQALKKQ